MKKFFFFVLLASICAVLFGCAIEHAEPIVSEQPTAVSEDVEQPEPQIEDHAFSGKYFVTFELKQIHFTLSFKQHLKDAMNTAEFEVMVDKEYYDSVQIGDKISNDFRVGSFIMYGSIGNWDITVIDKRAE